jgi:hypothetical protein
VGREPQRHAEMLAQRALERSQAMLDRLVA